jgi:hypothetical protein
MKKSIFYLFIGFLAPALLFGQFNFYGPQQFGDILNNSYTNTWTPSAISSVANLKYVVILDHATQTKAIMQNSTNKSILEINSIDSVTGSNATYGSMMRSIFQMVDENTHFENNIGAGSGPYTPLSGSYKLNPFLHSYYSVNSDASNNANCTDGGSYYMSQQSNTGFLLLQFTGSADSTKIKAVSKWEYNSTSGSLQQITPFTQQYLLISGNGLTWTTTLASGSDFVLADATSLLDVEIALGSDFNPTSIGFQPNATAPIPTNINGMLSSTLIANIPNDISSQYVSQLGHSASATSAASLALNSIESNLINNSATLRYPKAFYLSLRENMLSHEISSSDIYNGLVGNRTIEHVYFTNASDDSGVPHPFMVVASHAVSARPNALVDVNRPPGGSGGPGYGQSQITKNGKLGEFLLKIPLKNYGLTTTLLDNNLSIIGNLADDFDSKHSTTTTKDVFNYAALASCGIAVDGVTIYPAYNNNLRFAPEDAEITSSGIHVGGGLELHYHADGHAYNGNGINLYNLPDYIGKNHPPVIGMALDGIALFGKYESTFSSMAGYAISLDSYGGHDHGNGFGYHYHAHNQVVTAQNTPNPTFTQHFLLVGAWKGNINNIPGLNELKTNQLRDSTIARYAGASYTVGLNKTNLENIKISIYPNPANEYFTLNLEATFQIIIRNIEGTIIKKIIVKSGISNISLEEFSNGIYLIEGTNAKTQFSSKLVVVK